MKLSKKNMGSRLLARKIVTHGVFLNSLIFFHALLHDCPSDSLPAPLTSRPRARVALLCRRTDRASTRVRTRRRDLLRDRDGDASGLSVRAPAGLYGVAISLVDSICLCLFFIVPFQ